MQRFTISLDDELAHEFDGFIARRGYVNRSEAVRDLLRARLDDEQLTAEKAKWCVATVSYIFDHHEQTVTARLHDLQHEHHDLVVSSLHTYLDHDDCMETVVLRGATDAVRAFAQQLVALRGVRHGHVQLLPLEEEAHGHRHPHAPGGRHKHLRPVR